MVLFKSLSDREFNQIAHYLKPVHFPEGTCIMLQGSEGDGCYILDKGTVRLEIKVSEVDTDGVLGFLDPGMLLGEFSLIDEMPRSASAYAHTDVVARWLSIEDYRDLCVKEPEIGIKIMQAFSRDLTHKMRLMNERFANFIATDGSSPYIDDMVARGVAAQQAFEAWPEEKVDALLLDIATAVNEHAEALAAACVKESGLGVAAHKAAKIQFASLGVYQGLVNQVGAGLLEPDETTNVQEVASPVGVVFGLIPLTNPVSTIVFKTLICLKSRNAFIYSCHRNALGVACQTGEIIKGVLEKHKAPENLVQWVAERSDRKRTALFMAHKDVSLILATGGPSMVKAAYSSGTPAIGVGAGNAPVWICSDGDIELAAQNIVPSKSFDNGVLCGSENNLVVDASQVEKLCAALVKEGAILLKPTDIPGFMDTVFDPETKTLRKGILGRTAEEIAQRAGLQSSQPIQLIVVPLPQDQVDGPFGHEKMAPILSLFTVSGDEEGLAFCKHILNNQGEGHTAIIYTQRPELAKRYGMEMPASRILVNSSGSQGCCGWCNGLTPSLTLGCGTLGGSSTTDNVTYTHLQNIKRIAYAL